MPEIKKEKKQSALKKAFTLGCLVPIAFVAVCVLISGVLVSLKPDNKTEKFQKPVVKELTVWQKYMWGADKCVIGWTSSPNPKPCYVARKSISSQLKDPDSFKFLDLRCNFTHDSTATSFRDTVDCLVNFTATNSFGGRVKNTADVKMIVPAWTPAEDNSCTVIDSKIIQ